MCVCVCILSVSECVCILSVSECINNMSQCGIGYYV